jgi:DNA-binding response OmpR family regulator
LQPARPNVLVIEDDKAVAQLLYQLLRREDYAVETAPTGAAGLDRVRREGVDLVLLDLMLPDMDGLAVCQQMRAIQNDVYLPIIMLTALASDDARHAGFAAGADDYVTKPFKTADLLDRVRVWIRTRQYLKASSGLPDGPAAEDQPVLSMALSTSHDLIRLLVLLLGLLESWETNAPSAEDISRLRVEFGEAATALAARINALTRAAHYPA